MALEAARARYMAAYEAKRPPPPPESPTPPEPPPQPPKQPDPEPPATPGPEKKGVNRLGLGVLVMVLLGGGWWWKDQQDQRLQQAEEHAARQALAAEHARSEREAEKKRADEAEAKRMAAEKAQAQLAEKAAEAARQAEAERAVQLTREKQAALVASQAAQPQSAPPLAQTASGPLLHGRYQILAGGSEVKDLQTDLIWARCSVGQRWDGTTCAGQAKEASYAEALQFIPKNWKIPSLRELGTLVYCSTGSFSGSWDFGDGSPRVKIWCEGDYQRPTINIHAFPKTEVGSYWTSSESVNDNPFGKSEAGKMTVQFYAGLYTGGFKEAYVRLVRLN